MQPLDPNIDPCGLSAALEVATKTAP